MISVYCITFVLFLFEGISVIPTKSFEVIRGQNDRFSYSSCSEGSGDHEPLCQEYSCGELHARCDTSTDCKYCTCEGDKRTYYRSECVEDEDTLGNSDCKLFFYNYSWYPQPGTCKKNCFSARISVPPPARNFEFKWSKYMENGNYWKSVEERGNDFSIKKKRNAIKIITNNADALRAWNGSLLKLAFTYQVRGLYEEKCVILKFYTLQKHGKIKPPSIQPSTSFKTTTSSYLTSSPPEFGTNRLSHRTNSGLLDSTTVFSKGDFRSGSSSSKTVAISVSIVLLVLILLIIFAFLMLLRRRKRNQQQQANRTDIQSQNQRTIDEDPSPMYEELKDNERQIDTEEGYQGLINPAVYLSGTAKNVYDYIHTGGQKMKDPGSNEDEYSYASNDEVARDFAALPQPSAPDSTVYHTLEEPEAAGNPTPTHDELSDPPDQQAKNPVYAILEESNVESGEAGEVEPGKDPSEESRATLGGNDPYYHVLDISEKSV